MNPVETYIYQHEGKQQEIMMFFHDLLTNQYKLIPHIKYKVPFYYGKTWICYLSPIKKGGVDFSFIRGNELSNPSGIFDKRGRKLIISLHIQSLEDIPYETIIETIEEAISLDKTTPFTVKNSLRKQ